MHTSSLEGGQEKYFFSGEHNGGYHFLLVSAESGYNGQIWYSQVFRVRFYLHSIVNQLSDNLSVFSSYLESDWGRLGSLFSRIFLLSSPPFLYWYKCAKLNRDTKGLERLSLPILYQLSWLGSGSQLNKPQPCLKRKQTQSVLKLRKQTVFLLLFQASLGRFAFSSTLRVFKLLADCLRKRQMQRWIRICLTTCQGYK